MGFLCPAYVTGLQLMLAIVESNEIFPSNLDNILTSNYESSVGVICGGRAIRGDSES